MNARSHKVDKRKRQTWRRILIAVGTIIATCCVCAGAAAVADVSGLLNTPTPLFTANNSSIEALISYTQTAAAQIPITGPTNTKASPPTETSRPTFIQTPTASVTVMPPTATATATLLPTFTSQPSNTPNVPASGGNNGNCDPAYPGVCIPPPPPDLDCPEISYTNFTVLPPDPHGFDGDGDGVGCES